MTRLHPLSAVTDALQGALQFGSFGFFAGVMLSGALGRTSVTIAFLLTPLGVIIGAGYAVARHLRFEYELQPEHLVVTSGVFARQEREIPLRRVQNVDISRSLIQRVTGLATLRFETAGGSRTEAELDALGANEADRLRHEVGDRVRAVREGEQSADGHEQVVGDRPTEVEPTNAESSADRGDVLYDISTHDLLVLSAVSFRPSAIAAPVFGAPFVGDVLMDGFLRLFRTFGGGRAGGASDPIAFLLTGVVAVLVFVFVVWVASAVLTFVRYYDFRLERVADELRYERGLLGRYSGTIPLDKVQTVTVGENLAMRRLGYARLSVETAGYAPGSDRAGGADTTIPLATRERVLDLARNIQPFEVPSFDHPPVRARRRYMARYALASIVLAGIVFGASQRWSFVPSVAALVPLIGLPLAPIAARAKWQNRGYDERDDVILTRSGFWRRTTRIVPYYRLQTVFVRRGLFQRRWGLASVTADTASTSSFVGRDATAHDLDGGVADRLHRRLLEKLRDDLTERRERASGAAKQADVTNRASMDGAGADDTDT